ncbi:MAG: NADH-quinone oxidoreductase subunit A [bacterium]
MNAYIWILFFLLVGLVFGGGALFLNWFLKPKRESKEGFSSYECGEKPIGSAYIQYDTKYYLYGLIFLIFDVEVVFILPWACIFRNSQVPSLILLVEMLIFIAILLIGLIYAGFKGALKWE